MNNDVVMAAFQVGACFFLCLSIFTVFRDRDLKGVSVWMIGFFTVWTVYGSWNWYHLDQYWSFVTSVTMGILYAIWLSLAMAVKYQAKDEFLGFHQMMKLWDES